jgi:hypothetical protein
MLSAWSIEMMIQMLILQQDDSLLVYIDDHFRENFWGNGWEPCDGICTFEYMQVGQIYQKFECKDQSDSGIVRNVVRWSIENLLEVKLLWVYILFVSVSHPNFLLLW